MDEENYSIFEILGTETTEIRHSNMLAFLFSYEMNGAIGNRFLRLFLNKLKDHSKTLLKGEIDVDALLKGPYRLERENKDIDLAIVFPDAKAVILIENKTISDVHSSKMDGKSVSQLEKYNEKAQELWTKPKGYRIIASILIKPFQTPGVPYEVKPWVQMNYDQIRDCLVELCRDKTVVLSPKLSFYLDDYEKDLNNHFCYGQDSSIGDGDISQCLDHKNIWRLNKRKRNYHVFSTKTIHQAISKDSKDFAWHIRDGLYFTIGKKKPYLLQLWSAIDEADETHLISKAYDQYPFFIRRYGNKYDLWLSQLFHSKEELEVFFKEKGSLEKIEDALTNAAKALGWKERLEPAKQASTPNDSFKKQETMQPEPPDWAKELSAKISKPWHGDHYWYFLINDFDDLNNNGDFGEAKSNKKFARFQFGIDAKKHELILWSYCSKETNEKLQLIEGAKPDDHANSIVLFHEEIKNPNDNVEIKQKIEDFIQDKCEGLKESIKKTFKQGRLISRSITDHRG